MIRLGRLDENKIRELVRTAFGLAEELGESNDVRGFVACCHVILAAVEFDQRRRWEAV